MRDFLGREIQVGDMVVYPGRQSSSLWMNSAKVEGFKQDEHGKQSIKVRVDAATGWRRTFAGRQPLVTLTVTDNVVVVGRA